MPYVIEVLENGLRSFARSDTSFTPEIADALVHYTLGEARETLYRYVGARYTRMLSLPGFYVEIPPELPKGPSRFEPTEQFAPARYVMQSGGFGVTRRFDHARHFTSKDDAQVVADVYKIEGAFVEPFAQDPPPWVIHDRRVQKQGTPGPFGKVTAVYNGIVTVVADHDGAFFAYPIDLFTEIYEPEVPSRFDRG